MSTLIDKADADGKRVDTDAVRLDLAEAFASEHEAYLGGLALSAVKTVSQRCPSHWLNICEGRCQFGRPFARSAQLGRGRC